MEVRDIGISIPAIIHPTIVTAMMKVLKEKVFNSLTERKVLDIGILIPEKFPKVIVRVVKVMDIDRKIPDALYQAIMEVVDVGKVLPDTIPILIVRDILI